MARIEEFIRRCNRYIDETTPWAIKDEGRLATVIYNLLDAIYLGAWLLQPFVPGTAKEIFRRLGQDENLTQVPYVREAEETSSSHAAAIIARDQFHETGQSHGNLLNTEDEFRFARATTAYKQLRLQSGVTVESGQPLYPRFEDK